MKPQKVETYNPPRQIKLPLFTGFWKVLGVVASFLIGIVLFMWGANLMINDWVAIRHAIGPLGNMVLMPMIVGFALAAMSIVEFLRIIRRGN